MVFKPENYFLETKNYFPFVKLSEQNESVEVISFIDNDCIYSQQNVLYMLKENNVSKKIMKFHSNITTMISNNDLMIAGDESGYIKVFNKDKIIFNQYHEHNSRINEFSLQSNTNFISCSDDLFVRLYDLSGNESIFNYQEHTDYVKTVTCDTNNILSGGLDNKMFQYDIRVKKAVLEHNFKEPIFKIRKLNENNILVGTKTRILSFDIRNMKITNSSFVSTKEPTEIKLHNDFIYISNSDGNLKSFNNQLKMISHIKFNFSIKSFFIENENILVSTEAGEIFQKKNETKTIEDDSKERLYKRTRYYQDEADTKVIRKKREILKREEIDILMNNHQDWLAVSELLENYDFDMFFSMFSYFKEQRSFKKILLDRSDNEIDKICDLLIEVIGFAEFKDIVFECLIILLSIYETRFLFNPILSSKIDYLLELIKDECEFQKHSIIFRSFTETFLIDNK